MALEHEAGGVYEEVFASSVPPVAALYHAKDAPVPDASKVAVKPASTDAEGGVTEGAAGKSNTVNGKALVPVPLEVVTLTNPVVPLPMVATISVPVFESKAVTGVPPIRIFAAVAPVKKEPLMVMELPTQPPEVAKLVITGAGSE